MIITVLSSLLIVLSFIVLLPSLLLFIIGLIKPDAVLWGNEKKTRKQVSLIYGLSTIICFILFIIGGFLEDTKSSTKQQINISPQITQPSQQKIIQQNLQEAEKKTEVQKQPSTTAQKKVVFSSIIYEQAFIKELISYLDPKQDSETIQKLQKFYDLLGSLEPEIGAGLDMSFQAEGKIAKNAELSNEMRQAEPTFRRTVILTVLFPSYEAFYNDVEVVNTCFKSAITETEKKACIKKLPSL